MTNFYIQWKTALLAVAMFLALCLNTTRAQWTELPALDDQIILGINTLHNGTLYTWGGSSSFEDMVSGQSLDITNGSAWILGTVASLDQPKVGGYGAVINDKIYLLGGVFYEALSDGQQITVPAFQVLEYDPALNTMNVKGQAPTDWYNGAGAVVNGKIYLLGGRTVYNPLDYNTTVHVYDPQTNTWSTAGTVPYAAEHSSATAIGNTIYLVGGANDGNSSLSIAYKGVVTGSNITWTKIADHPIGVQGAGAGTLNGKVYIGGGKSAQGTLDAMYKYDPATNIWSIDYALPVKTSDVGTMPSDGKALYWIGGFLNARVFKFTPGTQGAIAIVDDTDFMVTVNKGANKTINVPIKNKGVIDLTVTGTGAMPWLTSPQSLKVSPSGTGNLVLNINSSTLSAGKHQATATLTTNDNNNKTITVKVTVWVVENLKTRPFVAVIEEVTGSWCSPCLQGIRLLTEIEEEYDNRVIVIAYHRNQGGASTNRDPLHFPDVYDLTLNLGTAFLPSASFNRRIFNKDEYVSMVGIERWKDYLNQLFAERDVAAGVLEVLESRYDATTEMITAKVSLTTRDAIEMINGRTIYLTGVVTQDSILYHQETAPTHTWMFHNAARSLGPTVIGTELIIDPTKLVEGNILPPGTELQGTITFKVTNAGDEGKLPGDEFYSDIKFDANNKLPIKFNDCHLVVLAHIKDHGFDRDLIHAIKIPFPTGKPTGPIISQTTNNFQATIQSGDMAKFRTVITNLTDIPQELVVTRTQNNIPSGWSSYMNIGSTQLAPNIASGSITVAPNTMIAVELYVTGTTEKSTGTVTLQFQAGGTTLAQNYVTTTIADEPSSSVNNQPTTGGGIHLSASRPNPAENSTTFNYWLQQSGEATVIVTAINGEKVITLNLGFIEPGSHSFHLDASTLSAGKYVVALNSNGQSVSQQMTVIH